MLSTIFILLFIFNIFLFYLADGEIFKLREDIEEIKTKLKNEEEKNKKTNFDR